MLRLINNFRESRTRILLLIADLTVSLFGLTIAFIVLFQGNIRDLSGTILFTLLVALLVRLLVFSNSRLYSGIMKYASIDDLKTVIMTASLGSIGIMVVLFFLERWENFPRYVLVIDWLLNIIFIGGIRFIVRMLRNYSRQQTGEAIPILIVGAGDTGEMLVRELHINPQMNYEAVGFVDDDPARFRKRIHGVPVLGVIEELTIIISRLQVEEVFIAIPSADAEIIRSIVEHCRTAGVKFRRVPAVRDLISGSVSVSQLKEVQLEDLLGRPSVTLDLQRIGSFLRGKTVLITGAAGSIGSELCRQIQGFEPARMVFFDHSENGLYHLMNDFKGRGPTLNLLPIVGSITDAFRVRQVFEEYSPEVIFHAAAHKHVPMMEFNRREAVFNNVLGTKTLVEYSDRYNVEKFVMISTDKAVNPTSTMGVCKRVAELYVQEFARHSDTGFITVRFGNVLGSEGSVIPLFKKQVEAGGPITITHPDIERYFMTIFEAVQLVLQAASMGSGGEIFVLEMGQPVRIIDLAHNLITLSGLRPEIDIEIAITGLRPGEKLTEELWIKEEELIKTSHEKIGVARSIEPSSEVIIPKINALLGTIINGNRDEVAMHLHGLVPTYDPFNGDAAVM